MDQRIQNQIQIKLINRIQKTDKPEIKEDQPSDKGNTTIKPTETKKEDKKKVNTGDHTQVIIYVAAIIISSLAVVLLKRKKAEN